VLTHRGVDTQGLEHTSGKSFHWTGSYVKSLNEAQTLKTELNVFESFSPKVPAAYKDSEFLFLANIDPVLQSNVRQQMPNVHMVGGDTMNYWITGHRENLAKVLTGLDALLINDGEAKLLAENTNLVLAARKILAMGPKALIVKHGEYGATAFFSEHAFEGAPGGSMTQPFRAPAWPLDEVVDPTGAGDSFAGGFFGYLASRPQVTLKNFKTAMFYGGVMGSFAVQRFGTERLQSLTREEIDQRFALFRELSHLD
jgi:sugar/nucleoside kinase (ribokinase family)